jgi:hypothetical protein
VARVRTDGKLKPNYQGQNKTFDLFKKSYQGRKGLLFLFLIVCFSSVSHSLSNKLVLNFKFRKSAKKSRTKTTNLPTKIKKSYFLTFFSS